MKKQSSLLRRMALGMVGVALAACGMVQAEETVVMDGSTTVGPIAKAFAEYYQKQNPGVNVTVSESGSGNGAKSLINSACQIANMSRAMKDKEVAAAKEKGINPIHHVIAMDGIAVVVHPSNPVKEISMEKLHDIYTGTITNWKDLGGPDKKIVVISRDTNSGTYETFESLVMHKDKVTGDAEVAGSNGHVKQRIAKTPAAIAYLGAGFVDKSVKALTVDGVDATAETIASSKYPISRPLYMVTNGEPTGHVKAIVELCFTEAGKKIIEDIGNVPPMKK